MSEEWRSKLMPLSSQCEAFIQSSDCIELFGADVAWWGEGSSPRSSHQQRPLSTGTDTDTTTINPDFLPRSHIHFIELRRSQRPRLHIHRNLWTKTPPWCAYCLAVVCLSVQPHMLCAMVIAYIPVHHHKKSALQFAFAYCTRKLDIRQAITAVHCRISFDWCQSLFPIV